MCFVIKRLQMEKKLRNLKKKGEFIKSKKWIITDLNQKFDPHPNCREHQFL
jgi:hypothetical protein